MTVTVTVSDDCVERARRVLRVTAHSPRLQRYKIVARHTFNSLEHQSANISSPASPSTSIPKSVSSWFVPSSQLTVQSTLTPSTSESKPAFSRALFPTSSRIPHSTAGCCASPAFFSLSRPPSHLASSVSAYTKSTVSSTVSRHAAA